MRPIDADALKYKQQVMYKKDDSDEVWAEWFTTATEIANAPTIDTVQHAKWIDTGNKTVCSRCNGSISFSLVNGKWRYGLYCQTCGAKMDGGDTDA